jgi:soluble lytic murein transglycosylase
MRLFRRAVTAALAAVSLAAAVRASVPATAVRRNAAPAGPDELAQLLPFERNKVEPIDARKAFADGYQAYKRRDYIAAIGPMQLAAARVPELADYALFYLGSAQRDSGDAEDAANAFLRLADYYPQSVLADSAGIEYARLELKGAHPELAIAAATRVLAHTKDSAAEQNGRLVLAHATYAAGDFRGAYDEASAIRDKFPWSAVDPDARALAYLIERTHPEVRDASSLEYHRREAALLLREGQSRLALEQIHQGLAMGPGDPDRAEFIWMLAEASRGNPEAAKIALERYLAIAPAGAHAPAALNALARIYWRMDDTENTRRYFQRLVAEFPGSRLTPPTMYEIGRAYEDDGNAEAARAAYLRLLRRYPGSEPAAEARFRAPFMLYMLKRYGAAAVEFGDARIRATSPGDRDMFAYWEARSLEQNGRMDEAQPIFLTVATSIGSNYYPAIAAARAHPGAIVSPAAIAPELAAGEPPPAQGEAQFHLARVIAFRTLGLRDLEAGELRALEAGGWGGAAMRNFILCEFQAAGAWYDAIGMATRMAARGEIEAAAAERIRYPRGFWDLVSGAAARNQLDPYLVAALIRQESLYNPQARSVSDARGLMQLLPSTAGKHMAAAGVAASPMDLFDPAISVQVGTVYLRGLLSMFGGDQFKAVAAYNAGEHAVGAWIVKYPGDDDQWVENIAYGETRDYVKKVIGGLREYRLLYQRPASTSIRSPQSPG